MELETRGRLMALETIIGSLVMHWARSQSSVSVALGAVMANVHDNLRSARERAVTAEEQAALDFALESFNRIGEAMVAGLTAGAAETDPDQHPVR
jgi:L-serine deaminase